MKKPYEVYFSNIFGIQNTKIRSQIVKEIKRYKYVVRDGHSITNNTWWFNSQQEAVTKVSQLKESGYYAWCFDCRFIYVD